MADRDRRFSDESFEHRQLREQSRIPGERRSVVGELQRGLGNTRLVQMRRAVQRQGAVAAADAPDWIKAGLGLNHQGVPDGGPAEETTGVAVPGGGQPLQGEVRHMAESHLGVSMDGVSVVHGADEACRPIQALGFTAEEQGKHVVALSSNVDLATPDGQFTLMHELSHVAQQKKGTTGELHGLGGDEGRREELERHADDQAKKILSGG